MDLSTLLRYGRSLPDLPPSCYRLRRIDWTLDLNVDGATISPYGQVDAVPTMRRSSPRPMPYLAVDQAAYVLGATGEGVTQRQATAKADAFWQQMGRWVAGPRKHTTVVAALALLHTHGPAAAPQKIPPTATVAVRVAGIWLHRLPEAVAQWQDIVADAKCGIPGLCIGCGQHKPLAATLPNGVPAHLIPGAERPAQLTVLPQHERGHHTLPICVACGDLATATLETLLADRDRTCRLAGQDSATTVFGLGTPDADPDAIALFQQLMEGTPEDA